MAHEYLDKNGLAYLWSRIKGIYGNGVDYIVYEDTVSGWSVRAWNSGLFEMWKNNQSLTSISVFTQYESVYYAEYASNSFPSGTGTYSFIEAPAVIVTPVSSSGLLTAAITGVTSSGYSYKIINPKDEVISSIYVNVYARGYWKTFLS